jgi:hypothetical protein
MTDFALLNNYDPYKYCGYSARCTLPAAGTKAINPTAQTPPRVCNQSQSRVLRSRWAACTRLLSRPHTSGGSKFAWTDAESGMQARHDPMPCGMCYRKILTDQNSGFKKVAENQPVVLKSSARESETHRLRRQPRNRIWTIRNQPIR